MQASSPVLARKAPRAKLKDWWVKHIALQLIPPWYFRTNSHIPDMGSRKSPFFQPQTKKWPSNHISFDYRAIFFLSPDYLFGPSLSYLFDRRTKICLPSIPEFVDPSTKNKWPICLIPWPMCSNFRPNKLYHTKHQQFYLILLGTSCYSTIWNIFTVVTNHGNYDSLWRIPW